MKRFVLLILAASVAFSGCASAPRAQSERDRQSKTFIAAAGKSSIYVFRNQNLGSALSVNLLLDGKVLGQSEPSAYFIIDVEPGQHKINCEDGSAESFMLVTRPDTIYFVRQIMKSGYSSVGCSFSEVPAAEGKDAVKGCDLAGSMDSVNKASS